MRYKKLFLLVLIFSIFLTSCDNFSKVKKNQLIVETIDTNNSTSSERLNENKILSEEEAKLKALEGLEKYLNIKLYLTEVQCYVYFQGPNEIKNSLNRLKIEDNLKTQFEDSKSVLENGVYYVIFYPQNVKMPKENFLVNNQIALNAKTGEILDFYFYGSKSILSSNNNVDVKEAERITKEFIEKNNLGGIKNGKLVDKKFIDAEKEISYRFMFEDAEISSKKVTAYTNKNLNIISFSVGIMSLLNTIYLGT